MQEASDELKGVLNKGDEKIFKLREANKQLRTNIKEKNKNENPALKAEFDDSKLKLASKNQEFEVKTLHI